MYIYIYVYIYIFIDIYLLQYTTIDYMITCGYIHDILIIMIDID